MKILTEKEKNLQWLKNEIEADELELQREKEKFIENIKKIKREELIIVKPKLTIWQKLKKILGI
jgi:protein tyrosine/serine phosphatase